MTFDDLKDGARFTFVNDSDNKVNLKVDISSYKLADRNDQTVCLLSLFQRKVLVTLVAD